MTEFLNSLPGDLKERLLEMPVLITFLIAGADGKINSSEINWAHALMEFRSTRNHGELLKYYNEAERIWDAAFQRYDAILANHPNAEERCEFLADEMAEANEALIRIHPHLAEMLVRSFRSFAVQVAKADGGILGFGSVGPEENRWISLPMLQSTFS